MDIRSIIAPSIQDREALEEFAEVLIDRAPEIEGDIARLRKAPDDRDITANLFRAVHNIKGDASLCKFELGIAIAHPIESMLGRFRADEIPFSDLLAEMILLAVDRLELATDALLAHKSLENLNLAILVQGLEALAQESTKEIDAACADLIEAVTGFPPSFHKFQAVRRDHPRQTPSKKNSAATSSFSVR